MPSAMVAGLGVAVLEDGVRLVFLDAAKIVVEVAVARSLRCMEGAVRFVLVTVVDVVESSVSRQSNHLLPSLYVSQSYDKIR